MSTPIRAISNDLLAPLIDEVEEQCEAGEIPGAWKDKDGEWWVPDAAATSLGAKAVTAIRRDDIDDIIDDIIDDLIDEEPARESKPEVYLRCPRWIDTMVSVLQVFFAVALLHVLSAYDVGGVVTLVVVVLFLTVTAFASWAVEAAIWGLVEEGTGRVMTLREALDERRVVGSESMFRK